MFQTLSRCSKLPRKYIAFLIFRCMLLSTFRTYIAEFFASLCVVTLAASLHAQETSRRAGRPEEIAKSIMFLCSDDASYIHGHHSGTRWGVHSDRVTFCSEVRSWDYREQAGI
jgi:hypothetical protein